MTQKFPIFQAMIWVDASWSDPDGTGLHEDFLAPLLDHPSVAGIHLGNRRGLAPRDRVHVSPARDERDLLAQAASVGLPVLRIWRWGPWRLGLSRPFLDAVLEAHRSEKGGWIQTDLSDMPFPYFRIETLDPEACAFMAAAPHLPLDWEGAFLRLASNAAPPFAMKRRSASNAERVQCLQSPSLAPYLSFPKFVALEASRMCNLRCTMCVTHSDILQHPKVSSHPKHFDLTRYRNILDQLAPFRGFVSVCPQFQGEPLLSPDFPAMLDLAKARGLAVGFTSNATLWDRAHVTRFLDGRVDNIKVSIDGFSKETFESVRIGADYDKVVGAVESLIAARARSKTPEKPYIALSMTVLSSNRHEVPDFVAHWLDRVDSVSLNNVCINDVVFEKNFQPPRYPCPFLWEGLHVLTNGDVVPCCRDNHYEEIMGNAFETPLLQIWNNEKYTRFRQLHLEERWDEIPICRNCDTWMVKTREIAVTGDKIETRFPFNREYRTLAKVLTPPRQPPFWRRALGRLRRLFA